MRKVNHRISLRKCVKNLPALPPGQVVESVPVGYACACRLGWGPKAGGYLGAARLARDRVASGSRDLHPQPHGDLLQVNAVGPTLKMSAKLKLVGQVEARGGDSGVGDGPSRRGLRTQQLESRPYSACGSETRKRLQSVIVLAASRS